MVKKRAGTRDEVAEFGHFDENVGLWTNLDDFSALDIIFSSSDDYPVLDRMLLTDSIFDHLFADATLSRPGPGPKELLRSSYRACAAARIYIPLRRTILRLGSWLCGNYKAPGALRTILLRIRVGTPLVCEAAGVRQIQKNEIPIRERSIGVFAQHRSLFVCLTPYLLTEWCTAAVCARTRPRLLNSSAYWLFECNSLLAGGPSKRLLVSLQVSNSACPSPCYANLVEPAIRAHHGRPWTPGARPTKP